ncbi:MAG TPA: DUF1194 domain-containing protein [Afifellaceae bacterium]|nr:DUF1194 domain-containing protein [Afifellaceae bacterium]
MTGQRSPACRTAGRLLPLLLSLLFPLLLIPDRSHRSSAQVAAGTVDVAIVLAVDCSWSVDETEYAQQIGGLADAFASSDVHQAIAAGANGRIAVALMQWAAPDAQKLVIGWTIVEAPEDALLLSARIAATPRIVGDGATSITAAITTGAALHGARPSRALRQVIDISSDGINNTGGLPEPARDLAAARGITINGLTILNEVPYLHHYFRNHIIAGPGAFVEVAEDYADYHRAIRRKLLREIGLPVS